MPYVSPASRKALNKPLGELVVRLSLWGNQAGRINYIVSYLVSQLIKQRGCSYAVLNEFIGALECCKLELYRRLAAPYEDKKIKENGDVFD